MLAGRKTTGEIEGTILYSAQKASLQFLRRFTGYVEQFDTMLDILTVREFLMYTAELKRPHTESYAAKEAAVDFFIDKLALTGCQDTRIGNALARCALSAAAWSVACVGAPRSDVCCVRGERGACAHTRLRAGASRAARPSGAPSP